MSADTATLPATWDWLDARARAFSVQRVLSATPLVFILAVQAALTIRLMPYVGSDHGDEAIYIFGGHQLIYELLHGGGSPYYETWYSGAPVVYPVLAAIADSIGGLIAARALSVVFMLGATALLFLTGRRLFGYWVGVTAAALFAGLGVTQNLGALATFDGMSLALMACAAYAAVRGVSSTRWLLLIPVFLLAANAAKYMSVIFDPVVIGLAAFQLIPDGWSRVGRRVLALSGVTILLTGLAVFLAGAAYYQGIMFTTLARKGGSQSVFGAQLTSVSTIGSLSWEWIGAVFALGVLGLLVLLVRRSGLRTNGPVLILLIVAGLLVTLGNIHLRTDQSMFKHDDFGAWFGCIAAAYGLASIADATRNWQVKVPVLAMAAVATGLSGYHYSQLSNMHVYFSTQTLTDYQKTTWSFLTPYLKPGDSEYLFASKDETTMVYGDHVPLHWWQLSEDTYVKYPIPGRGGDVYGHATGLVCGDAPLTSPANPHCMYLEGLAAYSTAIHAHWFALVTMVHDHGLGSDAVILAAVKSTPGYVQISDHGGAPTFIYAPDYPAWERGHTSAPAQDPSQLAVTQASTGFDIRLRRTKIPMSQVKAGNLGSCLVVSLCASPSTAEGPMKDRSTWLRAQLPRMWREHRRLRLAVVAVTVMLPIVVVVASASATAGVNLVINPGLSQNGPGNFPQCWGKYGYGNNKYSFNVTGEGYGSSAAVAMTISQYSSGTRSVQTLENQSCSPEVTPGHQYDLGVWYMSNTPDAVIAVYRHDVKVGWQFWMDLKSLPVTGHYAYASVDTPVVPPDTNQISFGVTLYGKGTVVTDDYSMVDSTVQASAVACTAGKACTQGVWQVLRFPSPVRAIHAVLMYTGDVLLVAGSGNDPTDFAAGTFMSAVYNPNKGTFNVIPTPDDFFCAGHAVLPNGKVLILGGNKAYPTADGSRGYEGLSTSYIFNPLTEKYQRINNLNGGHWYPSATELGNGDVIAFGGLNQKSTGSTVTEYFKYNPASPSDGEWLPKSEINESYDYWGLYPAMILMQNGELFYTGSHVFGNNIASKSDIYNISDIIDTSADPRFPAGSDPITEVKGLQDDPGVKGKDMTDQSMSLLLPPAQAQKVMLMGGGNINYLIPATRDTDLIDLNSADPHYTPGPLLPRGKLSNGKLEPASDGKLYVSAVILPNGQVFETGGGLINREDPVYEAAMYNPVTSRFTPVAADPVPRTYHSSAFLLPDGRVMAIGNNPGDGSFDLRISVYSPPYLFQGPRPEVTSVASQYWTYGSEEHVTVNQKITRAELISAASVTHSSDPNQRFVELPLSESGDHIGLNVTTNPNIAPPGWYMLFVTNANGVPSVARWIHLGKVAANR